jgi:hypothetical protein
MRQFRAGVKGMYKAREWTAFHDRLTAAAKAITDAELQHLRMETARLREARLAKEALEPPAAKPRARPRRWP